MKILFIIPGAGDSFYCGNCFRDNLQASALRKAGQDVIIMPLYLPLKHAKEYLTAGFKFGEKEREENVGYDRFLKIIHLKFLYLSLVTGIFQDNNTFKEES